MLPIPFTCSDQLDLIFNSCVLHVYIISTYIYIYMRTTMRTVFANYVDIVPLNSSNWNSSHVAM